MKTSSDRLPWTRPHLSIISNSDPPWWPNIQTYELLRLILIQTTTTLDKPFAPSSPHFLGGNPFVYLFIVLINKTKLNNVCLCCIKFYRSKKYIRFAHILSTQFLCTLQLEWIILIWEQCKRTTEVLDDPLTICLKNGQVHCWILVTETDIIGQLVMYLSMSNCVLSLILCIFHPAEVSWKTFVKISSCIINGKLCYKTQRVLAFSTYSCLL